MKENLYKILTPQEWNISKASGFITTELDLNDGFIHLSNAAQLPTTLALYFSEHEEVILLLPCLLYTSPSPRDRQKSRMPSSA